MKSNDDKTKNVRAELYHAVRTEKEKFLALADAFYKQHERSEEHCLQLTRDIMATVERVLSAAGDWEASQFTRNLVEPLRALNQKAQETQSQLLRERGDMIPEEYVLKENECKVYVSLYQAEGHDMKKWEAQVRSIDAYIIGRPIYKEEADIRSVMRQKVSNMTEAYAVVVIDKKYILSNDFSAKKTDRNGFELITVEATAVVPEDVIEFVHQGKRYHFRNGRLVF